VGRLKGRIARLEGLEQAAEEGLTAAQRHYRRAFARATQDEQETLRRLLADGEDLPFWKLWERVLRREAPTLANDIRAHRDLLHRELYRLEKEWEQQGHIPGIGERGRALSAVITARVNRSTAISRGAEPLEDPEEAHSVALLIADPSTSLREVLELVRTGHGGWEQ
jgi:hypothetical protein